MTDTSSLTAVPVARILRDGEGSRPEVRLVWQEGRQVVVKDFSCGNWTCRLLGLYLIARERGAFKHLAGVPGVPDWCGQPNPWAMSTAYMEGERVSEVDAYRLTPAFYTRLRELIDALHSRGVAHGDLKRLDNILITAEGEPVLVDFAAAFCHGSNPLSALVFPYLYDDDLRAIYKLKARRTPELLTDEEQAFLDERPLAERFFRWAREFFRRPVQRWAGSPPSNDSDD